MRACVSFCCVLCVRDGDVQRNAKVKANASVVFMLWCVKRGNNWCVLCFKFKGGE